MSFFHEFVCVSYRYVTSGLCHSVCCYDIFCNCPHTNIKRKTSKKISQNVHPAGHKIHKVADVIQTVTESYRSFATKGAQLKMRDVAGET